MIERLGALGLVAYFAACGLAVIGAGVLWDSGHPAPEQPLPFRHSQHAGELGLDCEHCHRYAGQGPRATVPAMSICAECHGSMETDSPSIRELQQHLAEERPVEWNRVHQMPWHVHFTHQRHIQAGVECRTCHGDVQVMDRVRRVRSMEMGWCVSCHRARGASTDCLACHK